MNGYQTKTSLLSDDITRISTALFAFAEVCKELKLTDSLGEIGQPVPSAPPSERLARQLFRGTAQANAKIIRQTIEAVARQSYAAQDEVWVLVGWFAGKVAPSSNAAADNRVNSKPAGSPSDSPIIQPADHKGVDVPASTKEDVPDPLVEQEKRRLQFHKDHRTITFDGKQYDCPKRNLFLALRTIWDVYPNTITESEIAKKSKRSAAKIRRRLEKYLPELDHLFKSDQNGFWIELPLQIGS